VRDALQAVFHSPEILLDLDLPLPLAFPAATSGGLRPGCGCGCGSETGIALGELANALPKPVTGTTTVTPGN
jgi:hypothetical protein